MKTSTKIVIGFVVVVIVAFFVGRLSVVNRSVVGAVTAGTTNSTARIATVEWQPSAAGATTTSILNSDANDRVIESAKVSCTGIGNSVTPYSGAANVNFVIEAATTSTATVPTISAQNTNYVFDTTNLIATTTGYYYISSTTPGTTGFNNGYNRQWLAGSYLTFYATATNTATCLVGVGYLAE